MKKLNEKQLENTKGGGCMKWIRRYKREANGDGNEEVMEALLETYMMCIHNQY